MIKFENTEVTGWGPAIRGMRNPLESWKHSDSKYEDGTFVFAKKDFELAMKLRNAGTDHRKFMRMITVYVDITAPLYWWKEFDTYKVGTVRNSCSTMHKIHAKEFTLDDFSHEHLMSDSDAASELSCDNEGTDIWITPNGLLGVITGCLNNYRKAFLKTNDKKYWWQMIQLLPSSYNQKATIELNYEVLANMYKSRKNHKLDEWHDFCDWIKKLPYSELITEGN